MKILCPICKEKLTKQDQTLTCPNKHSFDIAKQGYINLNMKASSNTGDEKEMIKARNLFLNEDHYLFLKDKLNEIIQELKPSNLLDLACGEGYYTKDLKVEDKIGIDLSKEALKIASKIDKSTTYILKNIFDVPLEDNSLDLITTLFAPVSSEINRLLKEDGHFILVKPDYDHLYELKEVVYDNPYYNEVDDNHIEGLDLVNEYKIKQKVTLNQDSFNNLFKMTPYYHKTSRKDIEKLSNIGTLSITFSFVIDIYKISK